ncbi:MAG: hypothetical protein F6K42_33455, partial [Leptolyngbya sp. SIO1D8]|nr:hypothetical protein [Leptolyngbya sp. SIO1D8]
PWYVIPACIFLVAIERFQVSTIWALVLAGSLYGFSVEGIIVWQMYEALPFTISWTPLGWHVLIDVLLGWYWVRRILLRGSYWQTAILATTLGVFWGVWGTWYGVEQPLISPVLFGEFALITGGLWVMANAALTPLIGSDFKPTNGEIWGVLVLATIVFMVQIVPLLPIALFVLPPLLGLTLLALKRHQLTTTQPMLLSTLQGQVNWVTSGLLMVTPIVAVLTYSICYHSPDVSLVTTEILAPILMLAGFVVYGVSIWQTAIHQPRQSQV